MSQRHAGILSGAEEGVAAASPVVLTNGVSAVSIVATPRKSDDGSRGGLFAYRASTNANDALLNNTGMLIPWEECLFEFGVQRTQTPALQSFFLRSPGALDRIFSVEIPTTGAVQHRTGGTGAGFGSGTLQGTSAEVSLFPLGTYRWLGIHARIAGGVEGFMRSYVDDILKLDTSGINTQGNGATEAGQVMFMGDRASLWDDIYVRPRAMLIDAPAAITGTPTIGGTVTGGTGGATADVYAWESNTADSQGGIGDADLPADTFRLLLRNVSFGPTATAGGYVDNEVVTVGGLSGPVLSVDAPHAAYALGLEPGGQFLGRGLYIERQTPDAVGTDNVDGTLVGGATDRADALTIPDDVKRIEHTAAGEAVTVNTTSLGTPSTILSIAGVSLYLRASSDGADPNGAQGKMYDNGVAIAKLGKNAVAGTQTVVQVPFDRTAAGGQWTPGAGAGGLADAEAGYTTSTS